jgi:hypothetical protein
VGSGGPISYTGKINIALGTPARENLALDCRSGFGSVLKIRIFCDTVLPQSW